MGLGPWITHIMFKRLFGSGGAPAETAPELDLEALRDSETVILFKHSPTCGVSLAARSRVEQFRAAHPAIPVHTILVRSQRALSTRIAEWANLEHESPQVIVVRRGKVVSAASHEGVTVEYLARATSAGPDIR